jgi:hypothetical protein
MDQHEFIAAVNGAVVATLLWSETIMLPFEEFEGETHQWAGMAGRTFDEFFDAEALTGNAATEIYGDVVDFVEENWVLLSGLDPARVGGLFALGRNGQAGAPGELSEVDARVASLAKWYGGIGLQLEPDYRVSTHG